MMTTKMIVICYNQLLLFVDNICLMNALLFFFPVNEYY